MKNIIKLCLLSLGIAFYSCDDPYEGLVYQVYDVQPAGTYLQSRTDDFSEWIKVLQYGDLFNAVNQADGEFTVLAPTNQAIRSFYEQNGVSSIEELGQEYARELAKYHIITNAIKEEDFVRAGELSGRTLLGDALQITFDEDASGKSVYINKEAHISEFAISVANGYVYVLDGVLSPAVETIYEFLSKRPGYDIFRRALEETGWKDTLNITKSVLDGPSGMKVELRRYFTLFPVSDEVFKKAEITSFDNLITKLEAGDDYKEPANALNAYVAYHLLDGGYNLAKLETLHSSTDYQKLWGTRADSLIMVTEAGLNGGEAQFITKECDQLVRNGYIHPVDNYMPVKSQTPIKFIFDFCDYPEVSAYVAANSRSQLYQQMARGEDELYTSLTKLIGRSDVISQVGCYQVEIGPGGTYTSKWDHLQYGTVREEGIYDWWSLNNYDYLVMNIGYNGKLTMKTPVIPKGKYNITLYYAFDPTQRFMARADNGAKYGKTTISFDGKDAGSPNIYESMSAQNASDDKKKVGNKGVAKNWEFTETKAHTLTLTVIDASASKNSDFHIMLDYLLFEPVEE